MSATSVHTTSTTQVQPRSNLGGIEGHPIAAKLSLRVNKSAARWYAPWKRGDDSLAWFGASTANDTLGAAKYKHTNRAGSDRQQEDISRSQAKDFVDPVRSSQHLISETRSRSEVDDEVEVKVKVEIGNKHVDNQLSIDASPQSAPNRSAESQASSQAPPTPLLPATLDHGIEASSISGQSSPLCMSSVPYPPITSPPNSGALATQPFLQQLNAKLLLVDRYRTNWASGSDKSTKRRKDPGLTIQIPAARQKDGVPWADLGSTMYSAGTSWGPPDTPEGWDDSPRPYAEGSADDFSAYSRSKQYLKPITNQPEDSARTRTLGVPGWIAVAGSAVGSVMSTASVFEYDSIDLNSAVSPQMSVTISDDRQDNQGGTSATTFNHPARSDAIISDQVGEIEIQANANIDADCRASEDKEGTVDDIVQPGIEIFINAPEVHVPADRGTGSPSNQDALYDSQKNLNQDQDQQNRESQPSTQLRLRPVGDWTFLPRGPVTPTPWKFGWPYQGDTIPLSEWNAVTLPHGHTMNGQPGEHLADRSEKSIVFQGDSEPSRQEQDTDPVSVSPAIDSPNPSESSAYSPIAHQPHPLDLTYPLDRNPSFFQPLSHQSLSPISPLVLNSNGAHISPLSLSAALSPRSPLVFPLTPSKLSAGSDISLSFFNDDLESSDLVRYEDDYMHPVEYEGGVDLTREMNASAESWYGGRRVSLGGLEVIDEVWSSLSENGTDLDSDETADDDEIRYRMRENSGKIFDKVRPIPVLLSSVAYPDLVIYPVPSKSPSIIQRERDTRYSASNISTTVPPTVVQESRRSETKAVNEQAIRPLPHGDVHIESDDRLPTCVPILLRSFTYPQIVIYPAFEFTTFSYPHIVIYPSIRLSTFNYPNIVIYPVG
ncbi:hypothetical protein I317_02389 [Kwoniella heveanensis CBS 569]|nr:hypothetical protein I317_02389 [Kwoniella heveanensis CBS 569]